MASFVLSDNTAEGRGCLIPGCCLEPRQRARSVSSMFQGFTLFSWRWRPSPARPMTAAAAIRAAPAA